jgi:hypothetical protein
LTNSGLFVLEKWVFQHIFGRISGTTAPIGLKFKVRADFGHRVLHTKFQPLRFKDAEDMKILGGAADAELVLLSRTLVYRTFLHLGSFKRNLIDGTYKIY